MLKLNYELRSTSAKQVHCKVCMECYFSHCALSQLQRKNEQFVHELERIGETFKT